MASTYERNSRMPGVEPTATPTEQCFSQFFFEAKRNKVSKNIKDIMQCLVCILLDNGSNVGYKTTR